MKNRFAAPIAAVILLLTIIGFSVSANRSPKPLLAAAAIQPAAGPKPRTVAARPADQAAPVKSPVPSAVKKTVNTQAATGGKTAARPADTSGKIRSKAKTNTRTNTNIKSNTARIALHTPTATKIKQPASRGESGPAGISKVISIALSMKGVPYRHGGSSPQGFDCSGFTCYAFKNGAGLSLPRTSGGQARIGTAVSREDLVPGDIVYFNTNGSGVSHVGIYIGHNSFVHASCSKGITVTSLSDSYYGPRYLGARRVK